MAPHLQTRQLSPSAMTHTGWSSTQGGIQQREEGRHVTSTVGGLVQTPAALSPVIMPTSRGNTLRGLLTAY